MIEEEFKFEKLMCTVYKCERYGGPDNIANADFYRHRIVNEYQKLIYVQG